MIVHQQPSVQLLAVIVHNNQVLAGGRPDDGRGEHVLREVEFGQSAWVVRRIIGEVAIHGVGANRFANLSEAIFESGDTEGLFGVGSGTQNVQQEPKTGH